MRVVRLFRARVMQTERSLATVLFVIFTAGPAFAQIHGKVIGTVTDGETGQPLVGAQVVVEGTNLGNVTNPDGYYFINNVHAGVQRFTSQYLGYETITLEERVLAGQTITVDFRMPSEILEAEAIVAVIGAVIDREALVIRDNTISKTRFTAEEARSLPVDDIGSVITLGPGIYEAPPAGLVGQKIEVGSGFIVRGGRATETATYVDGALLTDFSNQRNAALVGNFAVEEVAVVTGGFNAEFGHAQSGVVNIVTREGGTELHGNVRFTTDGRFDTDGYDDGERDRFEREACCGFHQLQASIDGPILPGRLTLFGSLEATGAADIDPRAGGFNPAGGAFNSSGSRNTILPGSAGDRVRAQAKVTSFLSGSSKLTGTALFARDQLLSFNEARGVFQHLTTGATRHKTYDLIAGFDQQIFQTRERNLNLQLRANFHQTKLHSGTPRNPLSAEAILAARGGEGCGRECEVDRHAFESDLLNFRFDDVEFFFEDSMPNSVFNLPFLTSGDPDPVFGVANVWSDGGGFNARFNHRTERRYGVRLDLDSQVTRVHRAKAGFEWSWINLANRSGFLDGPGVAEVYDVDPRVAAAYVQDRLDFGDLVVDLGLRWDFWDPNARFPVLPGVVNCAITRFADIQGCREDDAPFASAPTRSELSPRLGVAHPITDETQVRLSYGKFYQLPELQHFFAGFLSDTRTVFRRFHGNPNLEHVETTAFEVGITHLLSPDVVLDVVAYNRDRRGAIRADIHPPRTIDPRIGEVALFANADNGNVKGFDIVLTKRFARYWSADLAWSLQWARGTTSSPTAFITNGFAFQFDPDNPGSFLPPPSELSPEDFDRLHSINGQVNLRFPSDFQAGTIPGAFFRDVSLFLVYNAHSGEPYTRVDLLGEGTLEDFGGSRLPWVHSGDLRLTRTLQLGESLELDVFGLVRNFLDVRNVVDVHPTTGRPDLFGAEELNSRLPVISSRFRREGAPEGFPLALDDVLPEFRDRIGRQDLDGNGVISLDEAQETLRRALVARNDTPFHYGEPRQVRFGAEIRF